MTSKSYSPAPLLAIAVLALCSLVLTTAVWRGSLSAASAAQESAKPAKIAEWVAANTAGGAEAEFLVILNDQADLSIAQTFDTKQRKGRFVHETLLRKAQTTQAPILAWLNERGIEHRSFYIINAIWVRGTRDIADALAARADVARIEGNPKVRNNLTPQPTLDELREVANRLAAPPTLNAPEAIELGVNFIRAPEVWAMGFTGQGIVIAGADTGIKWDHPALKNHYRGWDGSAANHNFNWHDSIHTGGGSCGPNTTAPCDDDDHGTHTVGTALGDDGGTNQIGVAPGAKFIGCRNMDQGNGQPSTYIECMEWFLAPYPVGGTPAQGDPSKAPDITTNSWGCPPSEGCSPASLQQAVEAQRAAGIMMVVAAGNSGSGCSTVTDPPSFYGASYTVGAISAGTGDIASFSSRGPATLDGSNRLKPEITAPGVSVRSAIRSGGYTSLSGTSMATPHTAGAVALLWSARPALRHQIAQTIDVLSQAAVHVSSTACSSGGVPNNIYGWGRLDIKAAVDAAGGGCSYSIAPANANFTASGGNGSVNVTAGSGCAWTATSNALWININSGGAGSGNGATGYSVLANTGAQRSGTITIAGQTFTVTQDANFCPAITVGPENLANGFVNAAYNQSFTQMGGAPAITWSLIAGALPNGLSLNNGTGQLSGAPTASGTFGFTIKATDSGGCTGARAYTVVISGAGLQFYPLAHPVRLLDTRPGFAGCDSPGTPIQGGSARLQLARRSCDGLQIPPNAAAITGNITTVESGGGYLTLYPSGAGQSLAANSNYGAHEILNNVFTVGLGAGAGGFNIFALTTTHVVVDVTGYYAPPPPVAAGGLFFHPLPRPIRLLETRAGLTGCNVTGAPLAGGAETTRQARINCDGMTIPAAAQAIVGNATTVGPQGQGYLTLFPATAARPLVSSSNFLTGQIMNAPFTVGLSSAGEFKIYSTTQTDLVIDVLGYYSAEAGDANGQGLLFTALPYPVRLLETRPGLTGCYTTNAPIQGGAERTQASRGICDGAAIAADALALVGNATVTNVPGPGGSYLTFWPSTAARPLVATSNFFAGQTFNRHFTVGLGNTGAFNLFSVLTTDLIIDLSGYFAP